MSTRHAVHTRRNLSLLAAREKQLLIAIAGRLPAWIHSDHLSGLALASMGIAAAGFMAMRGSPWGSAVVVLGLVLNWFGDSLDGTVARVRGHERPRFGYYVDHVIDLAGTAVLLGGLALSGLMTPALAAALLAAYFLVAGESFLATHASGVFRMSWMGVGPTELRLALMAGALYAAWRPMVNVPVLGLRPLFDIGAIVGTAGLVVAFISAAVRQTRDLYLQEPRPSA